ncbi:MULTISPECIES: hypothetical protein [unclassified Sphingomonas]|uniref:hypothetical protein n=1 Tax=unclassified Sphingomonas TaxID=196159 RepID=UPI000AE57479|nr:MULTISPECIES: hypothetical protein [unclassified Sphingomonas]
MSIGPYPWFTDVPQLGLGLRRSTDEGFSQLSRQGPGGSAVQVSKSKTTIGQAQHRKFDPPGKDFSIERTGAE